MENTRVATLVFFCLIFKFSQQREKDLFNDDFVKQFKPGDELITFLKQFQKKASRIFVDEKKIKLSDKARLFFSMRIKT